MTRGGQRRTTVRAAPTAASGSWLVLAAARVGVWGKWLHRHDRMVTKCETIGIIALVLVANAPAVPRRREVPLQPSLRTAMSPSVAPRDDCRRP